MDENKNLDPVRKIYGVVAEDVKEVLAEALDDSTEKKIQKEKKLHRTIRHQQHTID